MASAITATTTNPQEIQNQHLHTTSTTSNTTPIQPHPPPPPPRTEHNNILDRVIITPSSSFSSSPGDRGGDIPNKYASEKSGENGPNHHHTRTGSVEEIAGTDETSSNFSTTDFSNFTTTYRVIEYDMDGDDLVGESLSELQTLAIEENSPAAEAIRANASVRVSTFGKVARAVHMQSVRRLVKRATGATKSGLVRGKPPRIPQPQPQQLQPQPQRKSNDGKNYDDDDNNDDVEDDHRLGGGESGGYYRGNRPIPTTLIVGNLDTVEEEPLEDKPGGELSSLPSNEEQEQTPSPDPPPPPPSHSSIIAVSNAAEEDNRLTTLPEDEHLQKTAYHADTATEASKKVHRSTDHHHDLLKLLRRKRTKRDDKKRVTKSYVKGKVIDRKHELYTLSIAVMIGVRTSIVRTNMEINNGVKRRWVAPQDFKVMEKYEFRPKGGGNTPPHQLSHTFKFKDYAPVAFAYLRRFAGVHEFDFLLSVCGNANFIEFISNAKSGQFFFYSNDGRFLIKTMTNSESRFLRRMLPEYFRHCFENPNTMITRFFGMYRVKLYHLRRNVKFVIMNSVYYTDKYIQCFYDLKGSVVGRAAEPGHAVKKDNDLRRVLPEEALSLSDPLRSRVRQQLSRDCKFLESVDVMDYSLLVGVHHVPLVNDPSIATIGFKGSRGVARIRTATSTTGGGLTTANNDLTSADDPMDRGEKVNLTLDTLSVASTTSDGYSHLSRQSLSHLYEETKPHRTTSESAQQQVVKSENTSGAIFLVDDLDDEDDSSYLSFSERRMDESLQITPLHKELERRKQITVEKIYWPFHLMYNLHGHRRMQPIECPTTNRDDESNILAGYKFLPFLSPLSNRKDGGLEMDVSGRELPMRVKGTDESQNQLCRGKIFYMGVIDILQEYTTRKAIEAQYRSMQTRDGSASCVPPADYADRFLKFFDEITLPFTSSKNSEEGVELSERGEVLGSDITQDCN